MKKLCGFLLAASVFAAVGCTTDKALTRDKYAADEPLADANYRTRQHLSDSERADEPAPTRRAAARVHADEITEINAPEMTRRLEAEIGRDGGAMARAGK